MLRKEVGIRVFKRIFIFHVSVYFFDLFSYLVYTDFSSIVEEATLIMKITLESVPETNQF